ncbi:MAG: hypothetical protein M1817_005240 [Caeruleum heppii]|nr:MAG: hypothetical protein M1817_005240 [Caeruleum heppii]
MDAADDQDILLQRQSEDLLQDLKSSLPKILWRPTPQQEGPTVISQIRHSVSRHDLQRIVKLLEPFQEWPQLLDPYLSSLLPQITSAYLRCMSSDYASAEQTNSIRSNVQSVPLHQALGKILYIFCKIRGEKVVSRFLENEPKCLEPMITSFERWEASNADHREANALVEGSSSWEERYVLVLWLSHLLLVPFDLASISSERDAGPQSVTPDGIPLPPALPIVTKRLMRISFDYLGSASKQPGSARSLLVRLSLRIDMRRLGLLDFLVKWALEQFLPSSDQAASAPIYHYNGILSFLAGVCVSTDHQTVAPYLSSICHLIKSLSESETSLYRYIRASALARKTFIKIFRAISVLVMQASRQSSPQSDHSEVVEDAIDHMLNALGDKDTPVRYSASKSLSVITAMLPREMATEVVGAIADSMAENVLWNDDTGSRSLRSSIAVEDASPLKPRSRDLTAVDPLRWHGLTLTLAQLLFRRSPPPVLLPEILRSLLVGLEFEQRSSTGSSTGTNVRDAACFGIWALSRKYTTKEILSVDPDLLEVEYSHASAITTLQLLAVNLVTAASLDPAGNIRRGASAALQELIGRHPDVIIKGIPLIQVVDYQAVALRSHAVKSVAVDASKLDPLYWTALLHALFGWRGLGSSGPESRRVAAKAVCLLCRESPNPDDGQPRFNDVVMQLATRLKSLSNRQIEERHGLMLALAAVMDQVTGDRCFLQSNADASVEQMLRSALEALQSISRKELVSPASRPDLTAESACRLISSIARTVSKWRVETGRAALSDVVEVMIGEGIEILLLSLARVNHAVIQASTAAARDLAEVLQPSSQVVMVRTWMSKIKHGPSWLETGVARGYVHALGAVFAALEKDAELAQGSIGPLRQEIVGLLLQCCGSGADIDLQVTALHSLIEGPIRSKVITPYLVETLERCLDDYTIDSRGDVGSWVRLEALEAVSAASREGLLDVSESEGSDVEKRLLSRVGRLAAEKLDKVRLRAWACLVEVYGNRDSEMAHIFKDSGKITASSEGYYKQMLRCLTVNVAWLHLPVLEGFVTSAGAGSETVLQASRRALVDLLHRGRGTDQPLRSLSGLSNALTQILKRHLTNDRVAVPTLEVLAFLFDMGLARWSTEVNAKSHFILVQKSHYNSTNVRKLEAAIKVYAGLLQIPSVRPDVAQKLIKMLRHPFPRVRNGVAESLYVFLEWEVEWDGHGHGDGRGIGMCGEVLRKTDWSAGTKALKGQVERVKEYWPTE